jgi:hypothetical protein
MDVQRAKGPSPEVGEHWMLSNDLGQWSFAAIIGNSPPAPLPFDPIYTYWFDTDHSLNHTQFFSGWGFTNLIPTPIVTFSDSNGQLHLNVGGENPGLYLVTLDVKNSGAAYAAGEYWHFYLTSPYTAATGFALTDNLQRASATLPVPAPAGSVVVGLTRETSASADRAFSISLSVVQMPWNGR